MVIYPVRVPRKQYRGSKQSLRRKAADFNADAARLEAHLNTKIAASSEPIQQFLYGMVAWEVGMTEERVREILIAVDAGHNGLTVAKSEEVRRAFADGTKQRFD